MYILENQTLKMRKIDIAFIKLGEWIRLHNGELQTLVERACQANPWFTQENIYRSLDAIAAEYLSETNLVSWLKKYQLEQFLHPKKVALILAGNIPLVGFHDLLCVLMAGHDAVVKLSDKDDVLLPSLVEQMEAWFPAIKGRVIFTSRLTEFDIAIATGSNQSAAYFNKYFAKYPNIIRRNRNAVAVLSGEESEEDILKLGEDIFTYFGLGCRSVSKLYLPRTFDFANFLKILNSFRTLADHSKYRNNYDYNFASAIINNRAYMSNDCLILLEDQSISSRIAVLHYEHYSEINEVTKLLSAKHEQIQCIVSQIPALNLPKVSFGKAQRPTLSDYADGVDTMDFLVELNASK
jgi:hypothetical protein